MEQAEALCAASGAAAVRLRALDARLEAFYASRGYTTDRGLVVALDSALTAAAKALGGAVGWAGAEELAAQGAYLSKWLR